MFRGNHPTRVDEKGRLKIPADFKRVAEEKYGSQFYITSVDGIAAQIWPMPEWEKKEQQVLGMPSLPAKQKWLDLTSYYGQVAEMDAQGRVLLPQLLRESGELVAEVAVLGKLIHLEVVNHGKVKTKIEAAPLTGADWDSLAGHGF